MDILDDALAPRVGDKVHAAATVWTAGEQAVESPSRGKALAWEFEVVHPADDVNARYRVTTRGVERIAAAVLEASYDGACALSVPRDSVEMAPAVAQTHAWQEMALQPGIEVAVAVRCFQTESLWSFAVAADADGLGARRFLVAPDGRLAAIVLDSHPIASTAGATASVDEAALEFPLLETQATATLQTQGAVVAAFDVARVDDPVQVMRAMSGSIRVTSPVGDVLEARLDFGASAQGHTVLVLEIPSRSSTGPWTVDVSLDDPGAGLRLSVASCTGRPVVDANRACAALRGYWA